MQGGLVVKSRSHISCTRMYNKSRGIPVLSRREVRMHSHKATMLALSLLCCLMTACNLPGAATPTLIILPTPTRLPPSPIPVSPAASAATTTPQGYPTLLVGTQASLTQAVSQGATQVPPATFCADAQASALINNFKSALQTSNGAQLASLVSPAHGLDARLYRNGTVVKYDQQHAKFLFETTYAVDWGPAPGSGQHTVGAFHDSIVPGLRSVFDKDYTLTCNEVKVGGASYQATWPYPGVNYYSLYYPGTAANGNMDWRTWLVGMEYVNGKPYLYGLVPFTWEP
jgi:hypothetical protein